jgi:peptidoglycan/LPS O-acetylase OafA/YrhL
MVIAFHVSVTYRPAPWLGRLAELGNLGVHLFFLVSLDSCRGVAILMVIAD